MTDDYPYNPGTYRRKVTSTSEAASIWFNRGLNWSYGFNHAEAAFCFENSIREGCPFASFGLAHALASNYNKPWTAFERNELDLHFKKARAALHVASREMNESNSSPLERALVEAISARYSEDRASADPYVWDAAYAEAMKPVYRQYGTDLDVAALYADALMNLNPWNLWDLRTGRPKKGARTLEVKKVLDRAMAQERGMSHPGLLHLAIHFWEMSSRPERALPAADALQELSAGTDAGHLHHMPSHLHVLCGDYQRAMSSNLAAIRADERYLAKTGALNFYSLYRFHNYHFRIYAALFAGNSRVALETVDEAEATLTEDLLRIESPPMADWLEGFLSMRIHVLVRFGQWAEILALPAPRDPALYCVTTAMRHYGRGLALAVQGDLTGAAVEQDNFRVAGARVPESRTLFNNTCRDILAIGAVMLDGELAYRRAAAGEAIRALSRSSSPTSSSNSAHHSTSSRRNGLTKLPLPLPGVARKDPYARAFHLLRSAVAMSDRLPYDEPWGWMQPPRHALGALLLEQDHVREAAAVYRADLGLDGTLPRALQHPNNVWALAGYRECLRRQGKREEAQKVERLVEQCGADVPVKASCFCATKSLL